MPPRTNDNAPDREQASQAPLPRPGRELGSRPTDTAGAAGNLGAKDAGGTAGTAGAPTGTAESDETEPTGSGLSDTADADSPAPDERVAAVRLRGESSRRWRAVQLGACAVALAVAYLY